MPAIERIQKAEAAARHQVVALKRRLLESEWPALLAQADTIDGLRIVCRVLEGYDGAAMRYIARRLVETPGVVTLLAVTDPSPQFSFVRSADVQLDMAMLLRQAAKPYGGRGGGRPHAAQGGNVAPNELERLLGDAKRRIVSGDEA
jgi:alanyl-tRNA synthetase